MTDQQRDLASRDNAPRDLAARDLERIEGEHTLKHSDSEATRFRRSNFPKDDRRSSSILTERERASRWPTG